MASLYARTELLEALPFSVDIIGVIARYAQPTIPEDLRKQLLRSTRDIRYPNRIPMNEALSIRRHECRDSEPCGDYGKWFLAATNPTVWEQVGAHPDRITWRELQSMKRRGVFCPDARLKRRALVEGAMAAGVSYKDVDEVIHTMTATRRPALLVCIPRSLLPCAQCGDSREPDKWMCDKCLDRLWSKGL
jgi:hypothetical protein